MPLHEFDLIKKYFAPLAAHFPGSLNLTDDAALIDVPAGQQLVVTKDAITEGVHFFGDEDAALIARKLLRVNLSDLAAMGAAPLAYFLAIMLTKTIEEKWLADFSQGLAEDQAEFGIHLAGGDTNSTQGSLAFSITALGLVPTSAALRRNAAKVGDGIYVSGTLGDSALGLALLKNKISGLNQQNESFLKDRYFLPQPRVALGQQLRGIANSAIDISDGLLQDMGHICAASKCAAIIEAQKIPLSQAASQLIANVPQLGMSIFSGGDDYELLFTVPPEKETTVSKDCTRIGTIMKGSGVTVLDDRGEPMILEKKGFQHL